MPPLSRRLVWLALGHARDPAAGDRALLGAAYQPWPELQESVELAREFALLLKRQMYGRANFDLLRCRVPHAG